MRRRQLLRTADIDDASAQFVMALSLHNACVVFFDDQQSMYRSQIVMHSESSDEMVLHGFNERSLTYARLTSIRPASKYERNALQMCKHEPLGIGVPVSHASSVYHQTFRDQPM